MPQSAKVYQTKFGEIRFNTGLIVNNHGETYTEKGYWFKSFRKTFYGIRFFDLGYGYKWIQMILVRKRNK